MNMPFEPGNQLAKNRTNPKPWRDAILRAIKRREDKDPKALEKLADKLLSEAGQGDIGAIKELGDRLDGKPKQETEHSGGIAFVNTNVPRKRS